jgi:DNA repair protein RecN (Recombination protein N)
MLNSLHIQNYAIIDEIVVDFSSNLNIITGETGAGKSIVMGALSLILGERADSSVLVNTQKKCFVEGQFSIENKIDILKYLKDNDFECDNELVIRREIATNGKSRAFINDTPSTLQQLKNIANLLVDLHQQFDTQDIGNTHFQRKIVDAIAGNNSDVKEYQIVYHSYKQLEKEVANLQQQKQDFAKEYDYNKFLFDELDELHLQENELENLDAELNLLSNSEQIKTALVKTFFELKEAENPIVQTLKQQANVLNQFANFAPALPSIVNRIKACHIELVDVANEIERINETIVYDDKRIEIINEKIAIGYKLLKKHGATTTNQLIEIYTQLGNKLLAVLNIDDAIEKANNKLAIELKKANAKAQKIGELRHKQSSPLAKNINQLLHKVGMPNASVKVEITDCELDEFGGNKIDFLFDANKSNKFEPIGKVASGGELSRLMLCIKSLVAQKVDLPTMIFDEIDTGISGEAAKQVGIIMKELANNRQIICITHQPQIAAKANRHLFVYKQQANNQIATNIRLLTNKERVEAIAKMLSGENPTPTAIASASEMMESVE